jgi:RNA polymerase sigma factor (sigma-70 family)
MADRHARAVSRHLRALWSDGTLSGLSDAELVARCAGGAEAAFEALVARHGPLVLGTCRRLLRDPHDAEDAFQATFLVLLKKCGSLRVTDSLGPWIYTVAYRVATRVRAASGRRRGLDLAGVELSTAPATSDAESDDLRRSLHEELNRLPEKYRDPIVLCHFEGLSYEEASRALRCPIGTVSGRLTRAREMLRRRLERRGLGVPAVPMATTLDLEAPEAVPAALAESTARRVWLPAAGSEGGTIASTAEGLARKVSTSLRLRRSLKLGALASITAGTAAAAAVCLVIGSPAIHPPDMSQARSPRPAGPVAEPDLAGTFRMPARPSFDDELKLARNAAEVTVLEAQQNVLNAELKKAAEELAKLQLAIIDQPGPEGVGDSKRAGGPDPHREAERLKARIERLQAAFADVHARWKRTRDEGMEFDSFIRRAAQDSDRDRMAQIASRADQVPERPDRGPAQRGPQP